MLLRFKCHKGMNPGIQAKNSLLGSLKKEIIED